MSFSSILHCFLCRPTALNHARCWKRLAILPLCMTLLLLCSCRDAASSGATVLKLRSGDGQCGYQNQRLQKPIIIDVAGRVEPTGKLRPAAGIRVRIEPIHDGPGAAKAEPTEGVSDAGGVFRADLVLGELFGDQYFRVTTPDFPQVKPLLLHAVAGVEIQNGDQEVIAGNELPHPLVISVRRLEAGELKPLVGLPVYIRQVAGTHQAVLNATTILTDERGDATLSMRVAQGYTGRYDFMVEVGDGYSYQNGALVHSIPTPEYRSRGINVTIRALSRLDIIVGVLGGLAIFIFGMSTMSRGLQQIAGDRLKSLLQMFAGNRFKAVLAGAVVTSLIQSSGATTVMVVGFVNAGLLYLSQAIGIIFGASVGTTVTAQMVSFNLEGLSLPAICAGVAMLLICTKSIWRGAGNAILGFGLLFFGMMMMSSELKILADFPSFIAFFRHFDCSPVNGSMPFLSILGAIAVGLILTVLVQSSSATVSMAIALAESGLLNYYTAIPLILGDNIGSTITGLIASIGTSRPSRQAALSSTLFKTIAVLLMLPIFYLTWDGQPFFLELIDRITPGDIFAAIPENAGRHLANAHTVFNIACCVVFLPFTNLIAKLARIIIPDAKAGEATPARIVFLESHLLNMPSAALDQVVKALATMTQEAIDLMQQTTTAFLTRDKSHEMELRASENLIDDAQKDIIAYLVKLTRRHLTESQSTAIPVFMHCVNDVERIGDRAINIFELTDALPGDANDENAGLSKTAQDEVIEICQRIQHMASQLVEGLHKNDADLFNKVIKADAELKALTSRFERNHEARLSTQNCTVQKGVVFVEILANFERISSHLTNLAERARDMASHKMNFSS